VVAAVRIDPAGEQDLVMLTVDPADIEQLAVGSEFILYRGNDYIVKVRVERILGDMVACRVIADTWNADDRVIEQGDQATTRLF